MITEIGLVLMCKDDEGLAAIMSLQNGKCHPTIADNVAPAENNVLWSLWKVVETKIGPRILPSLYTLYAKGRIVKIIDQVDYRGSAHHFWAGILQDAEQVNMVKVVLRSGGGYSMVRPRDMESIVVDQHFFQAKKSGTIYMSAETKEVLTQAFKKFG